jgi:hypothetical protein
VPDVNATSLKDIQDPIEKEYRFQKDKRPIWTVIGGRSETCPHTLFRSTLGPNSEYGLSRSATNGSKAKLSLEHISALITWRNSDRNFFIIPCQHLLSNKWNNIQNAAICG